MLNVWWNSFDLKLYRLLSEQSQREYNLILKLFNILQCRGIMFGNKVRYTIAVGFFYIPMKLLYSMKPFRKGFFFHYIGVKLFMSKFLWVFFIFHVV